MPTIASLLSNNYYGLNNQSTSSTATQSSALDLAAIATTTSGSSTIQAADHAYALDLSPDALAYIKTINGTSAGATSSYTNATNFTLTRDQKTALDSIITKYKDAPFTQETFSEIQDDLKNAGLSIEILSMQDSARHFNPTQSLLDALNGTSSREDSSFLSLANGGKTDAASKSTNFMTQVADQWARISTTVKTTPSNEE